MRAFIIPIAVEGDVQIFANPECTQYPTGVVTKLYARINNPWGFGEGWMVREGNSEIWCSAPAEGTEDDPYSINYLVSFYGSDYNNPFDIGQVIELTNSNPTDVTGKTFIFSKP